MGEKKSNTVGVKTLQVILLGIFFGVLAVAVMLPVFSVLGPLVQALPFPTPTNFIVADFVGMAVMAYVAYKVLGYSIKWGWR